MRSRLLDQLLSDDAFLPAEPKDLAETGLSPTLVEAIVMKLILAMGSISGREISDRICLPFRVLEPLFQSLRQRQWLVYSGSAQLNDYHYRLTDLGSDRARALMTACTYVGPAPVPLTDYVNSVEAQTIRAESPQRSALERAFHDITIEPDMFETMGPAINSGAGLFLYGAPGNGKTTIAQRVTQCFGQDIWLPHAVVEDGYLIKVYDAAFHEQVDRDEDSLLKSASQDLRWIKVKRPTVIVGGELTMDSLEIRHDPVGNVCEASLQMKSNCGCLLIDDFGRQRMEPTELLNRWIVPLENRVNFLTIPSGKKIQVPFEQLIIFSTNLDPSELTDDAFLRRIPYKIEVRDPSPEEFLKLFRLFAKKMRFPFEEDVVEYLVAKHYVAGRRPLRRCHPRDLLLQIRNYCAYNGLPLEMRREHFDRVVKSYFTVVKGAGSEPPAEHSDAASASAEALPKVRVEQVAANKAAVENLAANKAAVDKLESHKAASEKAQFDPLLHAGRGSAVKAGDSSQRKRVPPASAGDNLEAPRASASAVRAAAIRAGSKSPSAGAPSAAASEIAPSPADSARVAASESAPRPQRPPTTFSRPAPRPVNQPHEDDADGERRGEDQEKAPQRSPADLATADQGDDSTRPDGDQASHSQSRTPASDSAAARRSQSLFPPLPMTEASAEHTQRIGDD